MSKHFVFLYRPGPNWISGKPVSDQSLEDHLDYLLNLSSRGLVTIGGPFQDGSGGLVIAEATDVEEAKELVNRDPAIRQSTLTADVFEWNPVV